MLEDGLHRACCLRNSPTLNGATLNLGASVFPKRQFGFGGELSLRPGKSDYAGLQYRPVFYDFNGMESSNHFQLHFGAGVRFYVTDSIFVRPQFDLHWVNNFFQFGSNLVPAYGAVIGYSFGGH